MKYHVTGVLPMVLQGYVQSFALVSGMTAKTKQA
jgi:hypothetical protein